MGRVLLLGCVLISTGCFGRVEPDDRPAFQIDPGQPFRIEFGRGSGLHGLDTIRIEQDAKVTLHRRTRGVERDTWETATLRLGADALSEVLKSVRANGLMNLHRAYHADVHDGKQWVLWIQQGKREKSIYFNNDFPRSITRFAEQVDDILLKANLSDAAWQPVSDSDTRKHERELWDSIKQ